MQSKRLPKKEKKAISPQTTAMTGLCSFDIFPSKSLISFDFAFSEAIETFIKLKFIVPILSQYSDETVMEEAYHLSR